MKDGAFLV